MKEVDTNYQEVDDEEIEAADLNFAHQFVGMVVAVEASDQKVVVAFLDYHTHPLVVDIVQEDMYVEREVCFDSFEDSTLLRTVVVDMEEHSRHLEQVMSRKEVLYSCPYSEKEETESEPRVAAYLWI